MSKNRLDKPGDDSLSPSFEPADYPCVLTQLGRLSAAVDKELDLVNYRMMWIVISESFIFSAFATAAVSYAPGRLFLHALVGYLLALTPLLGIFLAAITMPAIGAAHSAVRRLKDQRDTLERGLPQHLRITLISWNDKENWNGNLPARFIPWAIIFIWLFLLCVTGWEFFGA